MSLLFQRKLFMQLLCRPPRPHPRWRGWDMKFNARAIDIFYLQVSVVERILSPTIASFDAVYLCALCVLHMQISQAACFLEFIAVGFNCDHVANPNVKNFKKPWFLNYTLQSIDCGPSITSNDSIRSDKAINKSIVPLVFYSFLSSRYSIGNHINSVCLHVRFLNAVTSWSGNCSKLVLIRLDVNQFDVFRQFTD